MTDSALSHIRIIDCTQGVAGPFCSKVFADLGADVIKVEPPHGDYSRYHGPFPDDQPHPERSGQFLYNNSNKRSVTLDLEHGDDRQQLRKLVKEADLLIIDLAPAKLVEWELGYTELALENDQLIMTCISPFGQQGPYKDYRGNELTSFHVGGLGVETPHNQVTDLESEPPLKAGGYQASYLTGWTAATASMVALQHRRAVGKGQCVDIAAMESVANMLRYSFAARSYHPAVPASRLKYGFSWILPCKDGHVSFLPFQFDYWWQSFVEMMGNPEWADTEVFADLMGRVMNSDVIEPLIIEWMMQHTKQQIYQMALERGLPGFPVNSMQEVVESRQFNFRNFFVDVDHAEIKGLKQPGAFCQYSETPVKITAGAPRLGNDNDAILNSPKVPWHFNRRLSDNSLPADVANNQPLKGIRVAEFGWVLAVPHATAWLASLGAEVIRIESNCRLDLVRTTPTGCADGIPGLNRSSFFNGLNFSKKSVTLDLTKPEGQALARQLIAESDIVTENFSVGVMEKFGLGYKDLCAIKPDIIMLSGSPLGSDGPECGAIGFGPNTQAYAGLPYITGYQGGAPSGLGGCWPDYVVGVSMAFSLLAALEYRTLTGKGQRLDMSMAEVVVGMIPEALMDYTINGRETQPSGNLDASRSPHGVYPCSGEDQWVAIAVEDDQQWLCLREILGNPSWASDPALTLASARIAQRDMIDEKLADWTRQYSHYQVMHQLQQGGVTAAACLGALELMTDPQLLQRNFLINLDHKEVGPRLIAGLPGIYSRMGDYDYQPTPLIGEHNEEIFTGLLGLEFEQYQSLLANKVIN